MLFGPDVYPPHEPGTGSRYLHLSPWEGALDCLDRADSWSCPLGQVSSAAGSSPKA
ncbi:hypothetical protein [Microbispora bryophytorum]|uniref:hypothetical protein n=1 Tax=Microbispora bryophytorum TaxID=1460882 RepID=UPI0033DCFB7C